MPLQIGYMSSDLFTHSVSYFAEAPLTHHNSSRVQFIVYNCTARADMKTAYLKQGVLNCGGKWKDVANVDEKRLSQLIIQDGIDILVELTGKTMSLALVPTSR